MSEPATHLFLDVPLLLERGRPQGRAWVRYGGLGFMVVVLVGSWLAIQLPGGMGMLVALLSVMVCGVGMWALGVAGTRWIQREQLRVESIEELIQLRRWSEAGAILDEMLRRPTGSGRVYVQCLIYLAAVLARYHRFSDAIVVYEHLLDLEPDPSIAHALRLGRAMSLLREDRLFDADRAISELRRSEGAADSAGLALVEIYRDVKTGHPQEALELFDKKRAILREQLGHRLGDALGLAARAYDLLGQEEKAAALYEDATVLSPPIELRRRYPELEPLGARYRAAGLEMTKPDLEMTKSEIRMTNQ